MYYHRILISQNIQEELHPDVIKCLYGHTSQLNGVQAKHWLFLN